MSSITDIKKTIIDREIAYWNIATLNSLKTIAGAHSRIELKHKPTQQDFEYRDLYFFGKWRDERGQPDNFIRKGVEQYKSVASIDRSSYEASRTEEVFIRRYNFWRGILKLTPKTKAQQQSQKMVRKLVWSHKLLPFSVWMITTMGIMRGLGMMHLSIQQKGIATLLTLGVAHFWSNYKMSSRIFDQLEPLPDPDLEKKRQELLYETAITEGTFMKGLKDIYSGNKSEIREAVRKEKDPKLKKLMYEMLGYEVIE